MKFINFLKISQCIMVIALIAIIISLIAITCSALSIYSFSGSQVVTIAVIEGISLDMFIIVLVMEMMRFLFKLFK